MSEITRIDVLKHFAGAQDFRDTRWSNGGIHFDEPISTESTGKCVIRWVKDNDLDDIKDIFTGVLLSRHFTERLLWLLWVREDKLNMGAIKEEDRLCFLRRAFASLDDDIDIERIVRGFDTLEQEGCIQKMSVDRRESVRSTESGWTKEYPLTPRGRELAEKMFVKMEDGRFAYIESPSVAPGVDIADCPRITQAASGRGNPKSGSTVAEAYQESIEWADEPADVNVTNMPSKKDIADAAFDGTFRAIARFKEPTDEVAIEKIHRLRCDGVEWKFIARTIYREEHGKDIDEQDLPSYVDSLRKQHKRQYPEYYSADE